MLPITLVPDITETDPSKLPAYTYPLDGSYPSEIGKEATLSVETEGAEALAIPGVATIGVIIRMEETSTKTWIDENV
jgi:hypothetical protein